MKTTTTVAETMRTEAMFHEFVNAGEAADMLDVAGDAFELAGEHGPAEQCRAQASGLRG